MQNFDNDYKNTTRRITTFGAWRENRTGVRTKAVPSSMVVHDFINGFPLLTLKSVPLRIVAVELEGFLKGITDKTWYEERGCKIWSAFCNPMKVPYGHSDETRAQMRLEKDLGPIYGAQWRDFNRQGIDQVSLILNLLHDDPDSRRMVCTAWNPCALKEQALPPCHILWQVLRIDGRLHLNWYQRSADWFLGVPFDMASYALLLLLLSKHAGLLPGTITGFFGDTHFYENQLAGAKEILCRTCRRSPSVRVTNETFWDWDHTKLEVVGYDPHAAIKVDVVV
ncbi:MAG: thymidylate synthase [Terrimicrobiaceae bacterium]|nr:thymidylate synthase [Terrimicrobiaceae bacterium]